MNDVIQLGKNHEPKITAAIMAFDQLILIGFGLMIYLLIN